tara:strand:+ start:835 stop:1284 length:450 start_codon:yes stop_codon:yes gene_type:complete
MPAVNFKIKEKFSIKENAETEKDYSFVNQVKENGIPQSFEVSMVADLDSISSGVSFELGQDNLKKGHLNIKHEADEIIVDCDAVFKVAVKPQYVKDAKSNELSWTLGSLDNIFGYYDVVGLKEHVYKYFNKRLEKEAEVKNYLLNIECS